MKETVTEGESADQDQGFTFKQTNKTLYMAQSARVSMDHEYDQFL